MKGWVLSRTEILGKFKAFALSNDTRQMMDNPALLGSPFNRNIAGPSSVMAAAQGPASCEERRGVTGQHRAMEITSATKRRVLSL